VVWWQDRLTPAWKCVGGGCHLNRAIADLIEGAEVLTARNTTLNLAFAFNYGSREEMAEAARVLARAAAAGTLDPEKITPDMFAQSMQSAGIPDADLVIRSGGERRVSNFLLWQAAYAEFVFTDKLWPDFGAGDLEAALAEFARRERRFGGVNAAERGRGETSLAETALRTLAAEVFDAE
jgi:undecaprenyl diphosphate synthase